MADCNQDGKECPIGLSEQLGRLRAELDAKHRQNRNDIHEIRGEMQSAARDFAEMRGKILPLMDNGQPGIVTRMNEKLDDVVQQITEVRIAQGTAAGRREEGDWVRSVVTALIIGLIAAVVAHFWK